MRDSKTLASTKDQDGDRLSNEKENELKTDPCDIDTDNDKLTDGFEVMFHLSTVSPLRSDSFEDGILDSNRTVKKKTLLYHQIDWLNGDTER